MAASQAGLCGELPRTQGPADPALPNWCTHRDPLITGQCSDGIGSRPSPWRRGHIGVEQTFSKPGTRVVLVVLVRQSPRPRQEEPQGRAQESGRARGGCPRVGGCNETRMLEKLPRCGKAFADMMRTVEVWKWCNLSEFIVYYQSFTNCTEVETNVVGCYWPNPLAQGFITGVHRQFFSNCTVDRTHWEDPPDAVLIPLIAVPVLLTVAMAGLVVWRSKRTGQLL
ncbi:receptor activity-modifying protein 3 isoform X1 [Suricata suricatta]|nr:receptor activity-modifying protein 3 isoform X1 [Suricata suricatta]